MSNPHWPVHHKTIEMHTCMRMKESKCCTHWVQEISKQVYALFWCKENHKTCFCEMSLNYFHSQSQQSDIVVCTKHTKLAWMGFSPQMNWCRLIFLELIIKCNGSPHSQSMTNIQLSQKISCWSNVSPLRELSIFTGRGGVCLSIGNDYLLTRFILLDAISQSQLTIFWRESRTSISWSKMCV